MKERVVFQDFNTLWAQQVAASEAPRMKDDQEEQEFWRRFMARKEGYAPDPSSRPVAAALLETGIDYFAVNKRRCWSRWRGAG